ncbi:MAG: glycosyltransferase family 4 protein [Actinomycetota bacterium]
MAKIVYDYQVFCWQKYGGVSRYLYELATHLTQANEFEVKVLAIAYVNEYLKKCPPNLVVGFPVPHIPRGQVTKILSKFNYEVSKAWLKVNPPDIIHQTYYSTQAVTAKGAKVVVTVHDMTHERLQEFFNHKDIFNVKDNTSLAKKEAVERADRVICVSENTKKDLIEILAVDPQKISVIYHGYSANVARNLTPLDPRIPQPYILYVGERGGYKNFQRFLQAYASSKQLKNNFNIVCFGGGALSASELNEINALELPEGKIFQIAGDDELLANLYRNASIFVYPSLYEGFGMPPLEAMALHCPVACSNTSCLPEVVGNAAALFNPYEPENIAEVMEKVLFSTDKSNNLIQLGTERIKHFSWEICAEQTKRVYLDLLS